MHAIYHYLSDQMIDEKFPAWLDWMKNRFSDQTLWRISAGSSSYSGYRMIVFDFTRQEDAAAFRLLFGGSTARTFKPTVAD